MQRVQTTNDGRTQQHTCVHVAKETLGYILLVLTIGFCAINSVEAQAPTPVANLVSITLTDVSKSGMLDVILQCNVPSCDAVALGLTFDPKIVQIRSLSKSRLFSISGNVVHLIQETVDNKAGRIAFVYITEDRGYSPFTGNTSLFTLTLVSIKTGDPHLKIASADIASMDGQTVYHLGEAAFPATDVPTTVTVYVQTEAPLPANINLISPDNTKVPVSRIVRRDHDFAVDVDLDTATTPGTAQRVMLVAPNHLACFLTLTETVQRYVFTLRAGDVNDDHVIDLRDAAMIGFGNGSQRAGADINGDGQSNILDLIYVSQNYGAQSGECAP